MSDGYTLNLNNPYDKNEILDIKTHKKYKVVTKISIILNIILACLLVK